jgi:uroporphyrin-III C-methyltransferase/precorrin-2 dehydrogenase/sirohydrochlorin ferrochelatase
MAEVSSRRARPPRLRVLATLPLFADVGAKRVVVAGDGDAAVWKAELAAAAGAHVHVYAPEPDAELWELRSAPPSGRVEVFARQWREGDLCGAALAIGALAGADARAFAAAARRLSVPVNIVDMPELSDVRFGSLVNRSPVVVAISTGGAAPVLGQAIRAKIEALLPAALGAWAAAAHRLRGGISARLPMGAARREVWRRFADRALGADAAPSADDLLQLASAAPLSRGSLALVGAGPGDAELLTLKALRALQAADIVLYDHSVSEAVLELARREARRMRVGAVDGPRARQEDIAVMLSLVGRGLRVVWLKRGDPMAFAETAEELAACRTAGIAVEVVPGVTPALAVAAQLQLPLVHGHARRWQFVTDPGEPGSTLEHDWASLADPRVATAWHVAARSFAEMLPKLIAAGLDPETPALAVATATLPHAGRRAYPVKDLPELLAGCAPAEPMLVLIGRGLTLAANAPRGARGVRALGSAACQRKRADGAAQASSTMGLDRTPILSTSTSTVSPAFSQGGGLRACATPEGVPVAMISPASSVMNSESKAMVLATEKIISEVLDCCSVSPLTRVMMLRPDAPGGSASAVTTNGPVGPVASKFLPGIHCEVLR